MSEVSGMAGCAVVSGRLLLCHADHGDCLVTASAVALQRYDDFLAAACRG